MPAMEEKQPDQERIVAMRAAECRVPVGEMERLHERERAALWPGARVTRYLHIFATRNVLEVLRRRHLAPLLAPWLAPAT